MNWLSQIFGFLQQFQCWITIAPWESALRIRFGKNPKLLKTGINFRLPFFDRVFIQTTRLKSVYSSGQTVTTRDGKALTVSITILYTIEDIRKLYFKLSDPDHSIMALAEGCLSNEIANTISSQLSPEVLEELVTKKIPTMDWGLGNFIVKITSYAMVKTYRIMQSEYRSCSLGNLDYQSGNKSSS